MAEPRNPAYPVRFTSGDAWCDGWHLPATVDDLRGPGGRPCVVMAHGLGGTRDSGLAPFADALATAGLDVVAFDYRGFGTSGGEDRQVVSTARQVEDYRAALSAAARLAEVDAARLVPWGVSLSGGHVLEVAAEDARATGAAHRVAAAVALTPLVDGPAAARHALPTHPTGALLGSTLDAVRSRAGRLRGRPGRTIPVVGRPGERAALSLAGQHEDYLAIAGPTWRNEVGADVLLELGRHRPARHAARVRVPMLVQVADLDRSAPPHTAARAAFRARAEVRHYPCDHFDVWPGKPWFEAAARHQARFLRRHLTPG